MYISFLEKISKIEIDIVSPIIQKDNKPYNTAIFKAPFSESPIEYKEIYFAKLNKNSKKLLKIEKDIQTSSLQKKQKVSLLQEIYIRLQKIHFLKATYDIEANKIDKRILSTCNIDYKFYNELFFWVNVNDLKKEYYINECKPGNIKFFKEEVEALIEYSNTICSDIKFNFWDFPNFSHNKWTLNITDKKNYNLQNIISLFFHETTHFFRWYNGEKNLWFRYRFESYNTLEEGIAIYNEYLYGNKLTEYWKFNPYYNLCYKVLLKDISEGEKKEEIYQILKCKWYSRKKSHLYYYRFYKYSSYWNKDFFLKDLIYWSAYKNVKKLIRSDQKNYEKIMSWHIGLPEIENMIAGNKNNFDSKNYFLLMTKEIKKYINKKA
jgi:hypothetical protein